jgi:hypothetical protein
MTQALYAHMNNKTIKIKKKKKELDLKASLSIPVLLGAAHPQRWETNTGHTPAQDKDRFPYVKETEMCALSAVVTMLHSTALFHWSRSSFGGSVSPALPWVKFTSEGKKLLSQQTHDPLMWEGHTEEKPSSISPVVR